MIRRIPGATYRLQLNRDFTFAKAREVANYLRELGITDCYLSPIFKAAPQSTHGYDICDFNQINPNIGGVESFEQFAMHVRGLGMSVLLDFVPNHMSTDMSNAWWFDVLEKGPASKHALWFDIDWQRFEGGKVLLPILEDDCDKVLQAGKLRLVFENQKPFFAYYDRRLPLSPESAATMSKRANGSGIEPLVDTFNGTPGDAKSFEPLRSLLQQQHYLLANWRTGLQEINYRRFFDINELISLRVELPVVFDAADALVLSLVKHGKAAGLRIDHPDGLWDPKKYCCRLREKAPDAYIVVEKILTDDESLPQDWPVQGTTGYDFLNCVNGLFVNQSNKDAFDRVYREFTGCQDNIRTIVYGAKKRTVLSSFPAGLKFLTNQLKRIAEHAGFQQFMFDKLRDALVEVVAAFPVYRTYVTEETNELNAAEKKYVDEAIADASARASPSDRGPLRFIHELLLLHMPEKLGSSEKDLCREFVMRFQQLTGPIMAKGLEDTTFYNFNRLISLNEVGGNPDSFGNSVDEFHRHNQEKSAQWPHSLLATATHDTKRGEDVRARINVLSELPDEWQGALSRWCELNAAKKTVVNGQPAPVPNDECFFYQTLLGAWPAEEPVPRQLQSLRERLVVCMLKSIKETKTHTSWLNPNPEYEQATKNFVEQVLPESSSNAFLNDFKPFQRKIAFFGRLNSLAQTLLKMTAPGVPDFYQGTELWDLNLVDPDNRRPVDFNVRQGLLAQLKAQLVQAPESKFHSDLLADDQIGRSKLYLIWRVLEFRNRHRAVFDRGTYVPLAVEGAKKEHICAFSRVLENEMVIVVVPRLLAGLLKEQQLSSDGERPSSGAAKFARACDSKCSDAGPHSGIAAPEAGRSPVVDLGCGRLPLGPEVWEDTRLQLPGAGRFANVFSGQILDRSKNEVPIGQILSEFPVALLYRSAP
jgi:(1->4)-alpha-D-glucan 1-alpha-D-glucosylmutase